VGQDWQGDVRIVLFVRLQNGVELDESPAEADPHTIRTHTTPRHVPAKIIACIPADSEGASPRAGGAHNVIHGLPVRNLDALANPGALAHFRDCPTFSP